MSNYMSWVMGISADVDDMHDKGVFSAAGKPFMLFMVTMYLGIRGFMENGLFAASHPLVQAAGIGTLQGAQITSTMTLPWSLKCVWAMVSDCQPIFYYKKRWYMLIATIGGSISLFLLGTLPYSTLAGADSSGTLILALLLMVNVMGSLDDCLTQGQYTRVIKSKGPSILVFRSSMMAFASLGVSFYAGVLNDWGRTEGGDYGPGPQYLMLSALPWAVLAIGPIAVNMMADDKQETACTTDRELWRSQRGVFMLAIAMGITVVVNIAFAVVPPLLVDEDGSPSLSPEQRASIRLWRIFVTNGFMVGVLTLSFYTIDRRIAFINVYLYLCRLCTFGLSYPLQQFYTTNPATCDVPDMNLPNFSFLVYSTFGGLARSAATFLGLYLFENYLVHWNAQKAFWVTTAFQVVAGLFDIMNTTRFNQTLLGWTGLGDIELTISGNLIRADDLCTFLFGSAFLEQLIDNLDQMPATLLLSKLCPKGIETTMFAILAGFSNIGLSLSGQIGGMAISYFEFNFKEADAFGNPSICDMGGSAETNGNPASFHGLARTLVIGSLVLPFLTIPLTWCFIPNQRLDEDFLDGDSGTAAMADTEMSAVVEAGASFEVGGFMPPPAMAARGAARSGASGTSFDPVMFKEARSNLLGSGILL